MQNLILKLLHHVLAGAGIAKVPVPPCSHVAPCWGIVTRRAQGGVQALPPFLLTVRGLAGTVLLLLLIGLPARSPHGSASAPSQHRKSQ